jgi:hypothetical protein
MQLDIAFIFSWLSNAAAEPVPIHSVLPKGQRLDLRVRDGMLREETATDFSAYPTRPKVRLTVCAMAQSGWVWQSQRLRMPMYWFARRCAGADSSSRPETDRVRNNNRHKAIARAPIRNAVRLRSVARYIPHSAADQHVRYDPVP